MRVAVLRCARLPRFVTWEIPDVESLFADDALLIDALRARGVSAEPVVWADAEVDWAAYDLAVVRSTWDYVDDLPGFLAAIERIERTACLVLNPLEALRWNADKHYLDDLDRWGVPIVPVVRGTSRDAARLTRSVARTGWDRLVVKPAVGVGGAGVVRADLATLPELLGSLDPATEVMVQPFAEAITSEGELSFVFVGDAFSHALRKRPAAGDFRAHGIYGGTISLFSPVSGDVREIAGMLARLPFDLAYARVDVVRWQGRLSVLELELIEPMLSLGLAPGSAERLAAAVVARAR